ncbi:MAG: ABC transporter permease subunit [bacterium]|nr:ABC transporter permease subunit [bacterium]
MKRSPLPLLTTLLVLVFFYLPIAVLVANSFNASRFGGTWEGFSLRWYSRLWHEREIWHAFRNTMLVATTATLVSTILGTSAAFALHRYHSRLQRFHYALIYTPLVIPEILMGMSLLLFFVALKIQLGLFTIFLAHVTFCISYVAMVVLARLQDFDFAIVEAAMDLGAGWWTTLWRVLVPLLAPGILAGALLAFTLSIDDFVISFFVAGPGSTTLPIRIYSMIKFGATPLINALSTILLVFTFLVVLLTHHLTREHHS